MEQWKVEIKNFFETLDQETVVSKKEIQSKWRIVEEGISNKKAKPFWIISAGAAAVFLLVAGIWFFKDTKTAEIKFSSVEKNTEIKSEKTEEMQESGSKAIIVFEKNMNSRDSIKTMNKESVKTFYNDSSPSILTQGEAPKLLSKNAEPVKLARSKQKNRKSISLSGTEFYQNNPIAKQKPALSTTDYAEHTEKGRHDNEKREDKNTIIKF